jgi:hypothetical protein
MNNWSIGFQKIKINAVAGLDENLPLYRSQVLSSGQMEKQSRRR